MSDLTHAPYPWDEASYQRFADARRSGPDLWVQFENGDELVIEAKSFLGAVPSEEWDVSGVGPFELEMTVSGKPVDLPWLDVRVLSDDALASHLARKADDQAQQVGAQLRALRQRRGLAAKTVALRAGMRPQSLSRIERGRHDVTFSTLQRLLAAMNYELSDLAMMQDWEPEPATIRALLVERGLSVETISRILHGVESPASLGRRMRDIFGWTATDLAAPSGPPLLAGAALGGRFKAQARDDRAAATYVLYAYAVAALAERAAERASFAPPPDEPEALGQLVTEQYGGLNYDSLLRFVWDCGIVVVPLRDAGQMHGACWLVDGRPVIVLKQGSQLESRWAFDLAHELCHVLRHLDSHTPAIVETDEIAFEPDDDEEREASEFARQLLLRNQEDEIAQRTVKRAQGRVERLRSAIPIEAGAAGVDVGTLANNLAFRLDKENGIKIWSMAHNLQRDRQDAAEKASSALQERMRLDALDLDGQQILLGALAEDPSD